ncbi:fasciclin domain family [Fusarium longipes]|uniref:Fasciclin domain family n=1 Tax=Fusarium longipes TaxID=694270 RepID=A0A395RWD9_9HYPO|nr:fasciclin domain family [Fusarium longipes]
MAKQKPSLLRALRALAFIISVPLLVQYLVLKWYTTSQTTPTSAVPEDAYKTNLTVWEVLSNDDRVSKFVEIIGTLPDIVRGLSAPQARFTVYAPVNEAFDSFFFPPDPPPFFNLFIAGCHMGPGPVPEERLPILGTVSSFVNGDIFFTYKQRISVQKDSNGLTLNHVARVLPINKSRSVAVNGFIHHIDTVLELPNSTAHALRTRPELSKFRRGLDVSQLSESLYDTNAHVSQTIFAPTNAAFDRLGKKATDFLFSHGGRPYLRALLKYHVVANKTLFSDTYWPHNGASLMDLGQAETEDSHQFNMSTLHSNLSLQVESRKTHKKWHLNVLRGRGVEADKHNFVPVSTPDIILMDGVMHLVDFVLLPPSFSPRKETSWLERLVTLLGHGKPSIEDLVELLGPHIDEP